MSNVVNVTVEAGAEAITLDTSALTGSWDSATVPVTTEVSNFTLTDDVGGTPVTGEGHYHIYLDGAYQDLSFSTETQIFHVAPGDHVLEVRVAENDHTEDGPRDRMRFTVTADRPDITIGSPLDGATIASDSDLTVSVENFTLDAANIGGTVMTDDGHYHIMVDGDYYDLSADTTYTFSELGTGLHDIEVELVNNDHTSLTPPVYDMVTVNVP
jgi:hypothetical protein